VAVAWAVAALLFLAGATAPAPVRAAEKKEGFESGFRGIPWGTSLTEARKRFPDLVQETYGADGEADHHVRNPAAEDLRIEGTRFDRIEYLFRKGAFVGIVATARAGSYKLYYATLREKIAARAGKPAEEGEERAAWVEGGTRVEILRRMNSVWLRVTHEAPAP
jgi:hypothetical protein